jgi:hypothetical protein
VGDGESEGGRDGGIDGIAALRENRGTDVRSRCRHGDDDSAARGDDTCVACGASGLRLSGGSEEGSRGGDEYAMTMR